MTQKHAKPAWRQHGAILAWITLPCLALGLGLHAWPRMTGQGGWARLDYLVLSLMVAVTWAALVVGYAALVLVRGGITRRTLPALAVVVAAVGGLAAWAWQHHAEEAACRAAQDLPLALAAQDGAQRAAGIAAHHDSWARPNPCLWGGLAHVLGAAGGLPLAERHAMLAALLGAGLPPDARLLHALVVDEADAVAAAMVTRRRVTSGLDPLPAYTLNIALGRAGACRDAAPGRETMAMRATLAAMVEAATANPVPLASHIREGLACLGLTQEGGIVP